MVDASACTDEICPRVLSLPRRSSRTAAGSRLSDTMPELMKRYRPPPMSSMNSGYPHSTSAAWVMNSVNCSIVVCL